MIYINLIVKNKKTVVKKTAVKKPIVKPVIASKMQRGIALLESLIAILIFSMGILAIVGLQGFMVKEVGATKSRSDASFLAQNRIAMIWAAPSNVADFAEEDTPVPDLPNGLRTTTVTSLAGLAKGVDVAVTIKWQQPGDGEVQHKYSVVARIAGAS